MNKNENKGFKRVTSMTDSPSQLNFCPITERRVLRMIPSHKK